MSKIHGGNIYEIAQKHKLNIKEILDFSASISPLGVPEAVMQAIKDSLGMITHYPDPDCKEFCQIAAADAGVRSENILAGNGAAELIYLIVRMKNPHYSLIAIPTFSEYGYAVSSVGGKLKYVKLQSQGSRFTISVDAYCRLIPGTDLVFICNPNNPTGTLLERDELLEIIQFAKANNCLIVVDEAYLDFVKGGSNYSIVDKIFDYDNLLILKSLTKVYSLPGLRIGYAIGNRDLINKMSIQRAPWSVNALAQMAGAAALQEKDYRTRLQQFIWEEREYLFQELKKIPGLKPYYPTANFILVDISETGITAGHLQEVLACSGLLIRDCTSFQGMGPYFIRIAVRTRPENRRLIQTLNSLIYKQIGRGKHCFQKK